MKSFDKYPVVPNEEAKALLTSDKEAYLKKIETSVQESLSRVYDAPKPGCLITFTEPKPAHFNLRLDILGAAASEDAEEEPMTGLSENFYDASNEVVW